MAKELVLKTSDGRESTGGSSPSASAIWTGGVMVSQRIANPSWAQVQSEFDSRSVRQGIRKVDDLFAVMWLNKDTLETVSA